MGGTSSTRKITIVNDESSGVIKISDSVVKRLKGESEREVPSRRPSGSEQNTSNAEPGAAYSRSEPQHHAATSGAFRGGVLPYEEMRLQAMHLNKEKEEEIRKMEAHWRSKLNAAEQQNVEVEKRMAGGFSTAVAEVGVLLPTYACDPVCTDREKLVLDCYQANTKTSLKCSKEVREFSNCVQQARLATLIKG